MDACISREDEAVHVDDDRRPALPITTLTYGRLTQRGASTVAIF